MNSSLSSAAGGPPITDESVYCTNCLITLSDAPSRVAHYKSDWHRFNVKRRVLGLQSVPENLFQQQVNLIQEKKNQEEKGKSKQECTTCNKEFNSNAAYQSHLLTKKHIKKIQGKVEKGKDADDQDDDEEPQQQKRRGEEKTSSSLSSAISPPGGPIPHSLSPPPPSDPSSVDSFGDWNDGDAIPLLHCLFCRSKYNDHSPLLSHMLKTHGFFIPFIENLIDLDGFLLYLGEKIGVGRVCLWCNSRGRARYPSVQAVQQHMKEKSHCKIRLETEEEEEEFLDFYSFPQEGEEHEEENPRQGEKEKGTDNKENPTGMDKTNNIDSDKDRDTKVHDENTDKDKDKDKDKDDKAKGRRLAGMNDLGELLMTDGSVIGHRQYNTVYRQHVRTPMQQQQGVPLSLPSSSSSNKHYQLVATMGASYKQLSLYDAGQTSGAANTKKDAPARFREAWWSNAKRKHHLRVGMANNIQKHYVAQVQF